MKPCRPTSSPRASLSLALAFVLVATSFATSAASALTYFQGAFRTTDAILNESYTAVEPFDSTGPGFLQQTQHSGLGEFDYDLPVEYISLDGYQTNARVYQHSSVGGLSVRARMGTSARTDDTLGIGNRVNVNMATSLETVFQIAGTTRFELDGSWTNPESCMYPCGYIEMWANSRRDVPYFSTRSGQLEIFGELQDDALTSFGGILNEDTYYIVIRSFTSFSPEYPEHAGSEINFNFQIVPEPSGALVFGAGFLAFAIWQRRLR